MKLCMSMWSFQELISGGQMDFQGFADYCAGHGIAYAELLDFYVESSLEDCLSIMEQNDCGPRCGPYAMTLSSPQGSSARTD